jgi:hypothetical protein
MLPKVLVASWFALRQGLECHARPEERLRRSGARDCEGGGTVPHYLPGRNPFIDEMTNMSDIPIEAVLRGASRPDATDLGCI